MRGVGPVPGGQDNRTVHLSTREGYDFIIYYIDPCRCQVIKLESRRI